MAALLVSATFAYIIRDASNPGFFDYYRDLYFAPGLEAELHPDAFRDSRGVAHAILGLHGRIGAAAAPWLRAAIDREGVTAGDVILLSSPGGDLEEALIMGRFIHAKGLATAVGVIGADGVVKPSFCASACVLAFAGGTRRIGIPGSRLGVHRFKTSGGDDPVASTQQTMGRIAAYLGDVGVSTSLITMMASNDDVRWLDDREAIAARLIDSRDALPGRVDGSGSLGSRGRSD